MRINEIIDLLSCLLDVSYKYVVIILVFLNYQFMYGIIVFIIVLINNLRIDNVIKNTIGQLRKK